MELTGCSCETAGNFSTSSCGSLTNESKSMTPEEARAFTASYVPTPKDFARVGAILAAQTRLDLQALRVCYKHLVEDQDGGAFFRAIVAMAETVVQKLGLREHPEAMEAPLSDIINYHRQAIDNERNTEND